MFPFAIRTRLSALAACAAALALLPGCDSSTRAYAPNAASARDALDTALAAWQKGGTAEQLAAASPQVHVVDHQWQAGTALDGYEVLEEKPGEADTEKRYTVRLKLKKPEADKQVEYIVIGREPLWIFRDDDYAKAGMMGDDAKPKRPVRRR